MQSPKIHESLFARLFVGGALDVWLAPVYMKKNRPGTNLAALCREQDQDTSSQVIFAESTTLGLRRQPVQRVSLPREMLVVETRYGTARVKAAIADGKVLRVMPEYEDCRRLADSSGVAVRETLAEVEQVAHGAFLGRPGH